MDDGSHPSSAIVYSASINLEGGDPFVESGGGGGVGCDGGGQHRIITVTGDH